MTIDEIIKGIEMVRDDLCEMRFGTACQRYVLADVVSEMTKLKDTVQQLCDEMDKNDWIVPECDNFHYPDNGKAVLAEFVSASELEAYYLVAHFDPDGWHRAIDNEPILDKMTAWKPII